MIDFRYHIVSLIAVFLALAVGIALGAGPLGGTIGAQLTEQVAQLRQEKDDLRVQLDAQIAHTDQRGRYIEASAEELLTGTLPRSVAVVTLPGADDDVVGDVVERLTQAGATVTSRLAITPAWTDPEQQSFRSSLVGNVAAYLQPAPAPDDSSDAVLGRALAAALTAGTAADPTAPTDDAGLILEVLTSGQLVAVTTAPSQTADAIAVIAPDAQESSQDAVGSLVALADAFAAESEGVVVGGPAAGDDDLVVAVRNDEAGERVATVDGVDAVTGQVSLPRALARALAGEVGHYGFAGAAEAVLPPRVQLAAGAA